MVPDSPDVPVACSLLAPELRRRRSEILEPLRAAALEVHERESGLALRFAPSSETIQRLAEVIDLERQCCAFLRFEMCVEPGGGPVWLTLSGPPGSVEFLASELGFSAPPREA
jgi:hypothetical protein